METIDLTPVGCRTQDGIAAVNAAVEAVDKANARCAELLAECWEDRTLENCADDIKEALANRRKATEAFLRALTGR